MSPIFLVSADSALAERVASAVELPVERLKSLDEVPRSAPAGSLVVYCTPRLERRETDRLSRFLSTAHHRLAILSPEADPAGVFALTRRQGRDRLVAIESDLSVTHLRRRLPRWHLAGELRPDWRRLRIPSRLPALVSRFQRLIEEEPMRNWSVEEIAERLAVARTTLNRAVRQATGRSVKALLLDLRYQLIDRARREGLLNTREIAEVFQFPSPEELHRWRSRHRRRMQRRDDSRWADL